MKTRTEILDLYQRISKERQEIYAQVTILSAEAKGLTQMQTVDNYAKCLKLKELGKELDIKLNVLEFILSATQRTLEQSYAQLSELKARSKSLIDRNAALGVIVNDAIENNDPQLSRLIAEFKENQKKIQGICSEITALYQEIADWEKEIREQN